MEDENKGQEGGEQRRRGEGIKMGRMTTWRRRKNKINGVYKYETKKVDKGKKGKIK